MRRAALAVVALLGLLVVVAAPPAMADDGCVYHEENGVKVYPENCVEQESQSQQANANGDP